MCKKIMYCLKILWYFSGIIDVLWCFQLHDGMWIWEDILGNLEIQNTSGLLLGVYSLWNVFTCMVLMMYPPVPPPSTSQGKQHPFDFVLVGKNMNLFIHWHLVAVLYFERWCWWSIRSYTLFRLTVERVFFFGCLKRYSNKLGSPLTPEILAFFV